VRTVRRDSHVSPRPRAHVKHGKSLNAIRASSEFVWKNHPSALLLQPYGMAVVCSTSTGYRWPRALWRRSRL
jgi:hypothetical protein